MAELGTSDEDSSHDENIGRIWKRDLMIWCSDMRRVEEILRSVG
jgi:hypothetical protein